MPRHRETQSARVTTTVASFRTTRSPFTTRSLVGASIIRRRKSIRECAIRPVISGEARTGMTAQTGGGVVYLRFLRLALSRWRVRMS